MKFVRALLFLAAVSSSTRLGHAARSRGQRKLSAYVQTWKDLHRGPPIEPSKTRADVKLRWITQKLDHFDENEQRTWNMSVMVNDAHYELGGPIFIFVGGEWSISSGPITAGHFFDVAKHHKAMLYYTEHRFYGDSHPTEDMSTENLKYLHVRQALADLAHFIHHERSTVPELADAKVILSGCSYSATMVVWFKRMYPELMTGGWASSAPLFAKIDFREYKEVVGQAVRELGGEACYKRIQNGVAELEGLFRERRAAEVKAMFKLCNSFDENNDLDIATLFAVISNIFSGLVQYQKGDDVPQACRSLLKYSDDVDGVANFVLDAIGRPTSCLDLTYDDTISFYNDTSMDNEMRAWTYQTCNEYGWYQSSASKQQPFGSKFPASYFMRTCAEAYAAHFTPDHISDRVLETNEDFGGLEPEVEDVHMTHGGLDPWSAMGLGEAEGATVLRHASHCPDQSSISARDNDDVIASKLRFAQLVEEWLDED